MTGKIFPESGNIYQDQAKILFNYYSQAAEKIVAEEERIEREIAALQEQIGAKNREIAALWWCLLLCFLLIPIIIYFVKKNSLTKEAAALEVRIREFEKQHTEIFRDYKVSKLGVFMCPSPSRSNTKTKVLSWIIPAKWTNRRLRCNSPGKTIC